MLACHVICFYVAWKDRLNRDSRPDCSTIALIVPWVKDRVCLYDVYLIYIYVILYMNHI